MCRYVYDLEVLQNVFGQVYVSMCTCVGSMCMTQKCSKLNLDKYVLVCVVVCSMCLLGPPGGQS